MNPRDLKTPGAGKGSRPRNNFSPQYRDNYDAIFGKKKARRKTPANWNAAVKAVEKARTR